MATMADLIQLYREVLEAAGLVVDEEGYASMAVGEGQFLPCTVGNKRLILPTVEVQRAADWAERVAFHPLSEGVVNRKESPVLKQLRTLFNYRLSSVISVLMFELMEIAADPKKHALLTPRQSEFLSHVAEADGKTLKGLEKVLNATDTKGEHRIVSIYLKRRGKLHGQDYARLAVVSFPIVEAFDEDEKQIFGVTVDRKKDVKTIEKLFNYIVPHAEDVEQYSYGSNSNVAPYFHALCHAFINVAKQLNKVTKLFQKRLQNPEELMISVDWEDELDGLGKYVDFIPVYAGNDGEQIEAETEAVIRSGARTASSSGAALRERQAREALEAGRDLEVPAPFSSPSPAPVSPVAAEQAPAMEQQRGGGAGAGGGMDWNELVAKSPALQRVQHPPQPYPAPGQPPYGYQAPAAPAPVYPQYGCQQPVHQPPQYLAHQQPAAPAYGYQMPASYPAQQYWSNRPTRGGYGPGSPAGSYPPPYPPHGNHGGV